MNRKLTAALTAILVTGAASAGAAANFGSKSANYTIGISGFVPVICHATIDASIVPVEAGEVSLGQLNEFCNNANGYQVFVDSSPELADASLVIDGVTLDIEDDGSTMISSSKQANIAMRDIALALPEGIEGGSLSVRIVAL